MEPLVLDWSRRVGSYRNRTIHLIFMEGRGEKICFEMFAFDFIVKQNISGIYVNTEGAYTVFVTANSLQSLPPPLFEKISKH